MNVVSWRVWGGWEALHWSGGAIEFRDCAVRLPAQSRTAQFVKTRLTQRNTTYSAHKQHGSANAKEVLPLETFSFIREIK